MGYTGIWIIGLQLVAGGTILEGRGARGRQKPVGESVSLGTGRLSGPASLLPDYRYSVTSPWVPAA